MKKLAQFIFQEGSDKLSIGRLGDEVVISDTIIAVRISSRGYENFRRKWNSYDSISLEVPPYSELDPQRSMVSGEWQDNPTVQGFLTNMEEERNTLTPVKSTEFLYHSQDLLDLYKVGTDFILAKHKYYEIIQEIEWDDIRAEDSNSALVFYNEDRPVIVLAPIRADTHDIPHILEELKELDTTEEGE